MGTWGAWWGRSLRALRRDAKALADVVTDGRERARLVRGLREPQRLPRTLKHALVVLATVAALAVWIGGSVALRLLAPAYAVPWDLAWWLGFVGFVTTVGLPLPFEPVLLAARDTSGQVTAVLASAVAKTIGAAVVFLLGGALRASMEGWRQRWRWAGTFLDATERFAKRWSYGAFAAMMAVPFFPDTIPVYVFALLRLKLAPFLAASFVGIAVRATVIVLFGRVVVG